MVFILPYSAGTLMVVHLKIVYMYIHINERKRKKKVKKNKMKLAAEVNKAEISNKI